MRRWLPLTNRTRYVPGTRSVKSSTPWRPGFTPVASDVHAGNVAPGTGERSRPHAPRAHRRASVGSVPSAIHGPTRSSVAPSNPTTTSGVAMRALVLLRRDGRGRRRPLLVVDVAERFQPLPRRRVDVGLD